jgi:hypothetical protein
MTRSVDGKWRIAEKSVKGCREEISLQNHVVADVQQQHAGITPLLSPQSSQANTAVELHCQAGACPLLSPQSNQPQCVSEHGIRALNTPRHSRTSLVPGGRLQKLCNHTR